MPEPLEWVHELHKRLQSRQTHLERMAGYHQGDHPTPFITPAHRPKLRGEFNRMLKESKANFCRPVVDVVEERMVVDGFRFSAQSETDEEGKQAERDAWDTWQANQLDANSQTAISTSLVKGVSYLSVWQQGRDEWPTVAVEDPSETIVAYTPGSNFRSRDAALKVWQGRAGKRADLYLPQAVYKYVWDEPSSDREAGSWLPFEDPVDNPIAPVVPIVPLRNRPSLTVEGESELTDVIPIQNQINGLLFLMQIAGYFGAHRQRWVTGLKIYEDEDGNPVEPFNIGVDRLLQAKDANVEFGEFEQTELKPYIDSIEQKIHQIAVITAMPRHYLVQQGQSPSGDAIRGAESRLIRKIERKQRTYGEGFEEALRLARMFRGQSDVPVDAEMTWKNPATPTLAERTDAVIKQFQAGLIPWETAMEQLDYSQPAIERMREQRQQDAFTQMLAGTSENGQQPSTEAPAVA